MARQLKFWSGRGQGNPQNWGRGQIYVCAFSQKQAAEIVSEACRSWTTINEVRDYFSNSWGKTADKLPVPTEPCVYAVKNSWTDETPILIYPLNK